MPFECGLSHWPNPVPGRAAQVPPPPVGRVGAVSELLERVIPGSSRHFVRARTPGERTAGGLAGAFCFRLTDPAAVAIPATGCRSTQRRGALRRTVPRGRHPREVLELADPRGFLVDDVGDRVRVRGAGANGVTARFRRPKNAL